MRSPLVTKLSVPSGEDIFWMKSTKEGFDIILNRMDEGVYHDTVSYSCDSFTRGYYMNKINYSWLYNRSEHKDILDLVVMTALNKGIQNISKELDEQGRKQFTLDGMHVLTATDHDGMLEASVTRAKDYGSVMRRLKEYEVFINGCPQKPNITQHGLYYILESENNTLTMFNIESVNDIMRVFDERGQCTKRACN